MTYKLNFKNNPFPYKLEKFLANKLIIPGNYYKLSDKQLEELARLEKSDERSSLIQKLQEERNTKKEQKKLAEAQAKAAAAAKKSADQLAAEARIRAKEQQQRNQQEDDDGPSYSQPTEYTMDTGFQDFTDFGGISGPMAKGGLASKPKPKKRMKRGGLASKK